VVPRHLERRRRWRGCGCPGRGRLLARERRASNPVDRNPYGAPIVLDADPQGRTGRHAWDGKNGAQQEYGQMSSAHEAPSGTPHSDHRHTAANA
jgi:hypothetical protein